MERAEDTAVRQGEAGDAGSLAEDRYEIAAATQVDGLGESWAVSHVDRAQQFVVTEIQLCQVGIAVVVPIPEF